MRKVLPTVAILALLMAFTMTAGGCDSDIDWKALAKNAITEFVGQQMIIAFTQFDNNELEIKGAVTKAITNARWLDPYLDEVGDAFVAVAVGKVYDIINAKWYEVLSAKGYDVDGDDFQNWSGLIYDVSVADFPDIYDIELIE
jgi:hypothetical protein